LALSIQTVSKRLRWAAVQQFLLYKLCKVPAPRNCVMVAL